MTGGCRGKKGMGVGQVFVFIIAALTFALILIFGYKAITGFIGKGEQVQFVQFKTELENSIKKIYTEYGAVRIETFSPPAEFKKICFVDMDYAGEMSSLAEELPAAYDAWQTAKEEGGYAAADQNVFLIPTAPVPIKVYHLSIEDGGSKGYLCLPIARGTFRLVLEGKGDHTALSRVEAPEG